MTIEETFKVVEIYMFDRSKQHVQSFHIVENAHNVIEVARYVLESSTQELTWLENKMVKILANESYFDLDAW